MKKIDKSKHLATAYFEWLNFLPQNSVVEYDSSKNSFYKDVVMNLLNCQKGVCAYTEIYLADKQWFETNNWENGKYVSNYKNKGHLEHFDPELKNKNGWDWNNLFVVDSDTNTKIKGKKKVNYILKPDLNDYSPNIYLSYNLKLNFFIPNQKLINTDIYNSVKEMIDVLGLNFDAIVDARRIYFNKIEKRIKKKTSDYEEEKKELYQFFTAFEMSLDYFKQLE